MLSKTPLETNRTENTVHVFPASPLWRRWSTLSTSQRFSFTDKEPVACLNTVSLMCPSAAIDFVFRSAGVSSCHVSAGFEHSTDLVIHP